MHIQDKQHPLCLGLDRIQVLSKQDPMRLGQLFTERAILAQQIREEAFKKAGIAFSYRDADYPDCLIEENSLMVGALLLSLILQRNMLSALSVKSHPAPLNYCRLWRL